MQLQSSACPNCGQPTNPNALFCPNCGSSKATVAAKHHPNSGPTIGVVQNTGVVLTPLKPGDFVGSNGRYRIEQLIGAGGFGETFEATDTQLDRSCVVKRMLVDPAWNANQHQMMVANFEREAKLLATLNSPGHPNIPDVYEYLPHDYCLVMKYIEGKNLSASGKIPQQTALQYIRDVCNALVYMHARKPEPALHRDIKPDNILLGNNGRVWLIDFGLAKSLPVASVGASHGSLMAGTLGYTPPEQWQSAAEPRSDVYALGATLHTLLTGYRPPFSQADIPDLVSGTKGGFPFIRTLDAKLDSRVETLIVQCMEFDVRKRPTATQMLKTLDEILERFQSKPRGAVATSIKAPNGATIATTHELAAWCDMHWQDACEWLQGRMPDVVETAWFDAQLAKHMRELRIKHRQDIHAALDMVISILDPGSSRTIAIRVQPNPINFGNVVVSNQLIGKEITIKNTGQRYVALHINAGNWLSVSVNVNNNVPIEIRLLPNTSQKVIVYADMHNQKIGGKIKAQLYLVSHNSFNESIVASARLPYWKTIWSEVIVVVVKNIFGALFSLLKAIFAGKSKNNRRISNLPTIINISFLVFMIYACVSIFTPFNTYRSDPQVTQKAVSATIRPRPSTTPSLVLEATTTPTTPQRQQGRITGARSLNIRNASNADAKDIGDIFENDTFDLTGAEANGWYEVQFGDITGWVNGKFVERIQ